MIILLKLRWLAQPILTDLMLSTNKQNNSTSFLCPSKLWKSCNVVLNHLPFIELPAIANKKDLLFVINNLLQQNNDNVIIITNENYMYAYKYLKNRQLTKINVKSIALLFLLIKSTKILLIVNKCKERESHSRKYL